MTAKMNIGMHVSLQISVFVFLLQYLVGVLIADQQRICQSGPHRVSGRRPGDLELRPAGEWGLMVLELVTARCPKLQVMKIPGLLSASGWVRLRSRTLETVGSAHCVQSRSSGSGRGPRNPGSARPLVKVETGAQAPWVGLGAQGFLCMHKLVGHGLLPD